MKEKILKLLKENKSGLHIQAIADKLKKSRSTVRIELAMLEGSEKVEVKKIGRNRVYSIYWRAKFR